MLYLNLLYLLFIVLIIILLLLIFSYSSARSKNIFFTNDPTGKNTSINTTLKSIVIDSDTLSFTPTLSYRSQEINGKFAIQLSSNETVDIFVQAVDNGKVIGEKTRYTVWEKNTYGITQITLIFDSNTLDNTAHVITPQISTVSSSSAIVNIHSMSVYYY